MKALLAYIVIAVAAVLGGYGAAHLFHYQQTQSVEEEFFSNQWEVSDASMLSSQVQLDAPVHNFGTIDATKDYRHEFLIQNTGTLDLEIWYDGPELSPLNLDLTEEKVVIKRGTSHPVTVQFNAEDIQQNFNIEISIKTNQPNNQPVILKVSGQIPNE